MKNYSLIYLLIFAIYGASMVAVHYAMRNIDRALQKKRDNRE